MKAAFYTLGCKVNQYESEYMAELLRSAGFEIVSPDQEADYYIVNSCTVTATADQKTRQSVRRFKRRHPGATVILTGCMPQAFPEEAKAQLDADIVFSNKSDGDIFSIINRYHTEKSRIVDINAHQTGDPFAPCAISGFGQRVRAFVKIEDGCDRFCSYCIIPYARGRVRSRRPESVVEEVRHLAANGYREVVLTGIHLSSYGIDLDEEIGLLELIRAVHAVEGIERIRLGSLEPRIITEEFARSLSELPKVCPHFHLSLQSGCDETLKRMNRRYNSEEYYEKCTLLRKYFQDPALTTDVIVGFPGETEEEFEASRAFVERVSFYETHIFKYSRREGTRAAVMKDQVPEQIKAKRSAVLIGLGHEKQNEYERKYTGREVEVLIEETAEIGGKEVWIGHTKEYIKVAVSSEENLQNRIVKGTVGKDLQIIH